MRSGNLRKSSDDVWKDIKSALSNETSVETLVRKVKNKIISVEKDRLNLSPKELEELERFHVHSPSMFGTF